MQPSIGPSRAGAAIVVLVFALAAACREATSPDPAPPPATPAASDTSRSTTPTTPPAPPPAAALAPIGVSIMTTGTNPDPDGYLLMVDDSIKLPVKVNDTVTTKPLAWQYSHSVQLTNIAPNCATDTMSVQILRPVSTHGPSVTFTVSCIGPSIPPGMAGAQLLFVRQGRIYRTTVGGGSGTPLTTGEDPTWSPDGRRIAFTRGADVYVMDANGTNERLVATGSFEYRAWENYLGGLAPAWSPDGTHLALYSDHGIVIIPVDNLGAPASLTVPSWFLSASPAWSPDGSKLAFTNDIESWGGGEALNVYVRDVGDSSFAHATQLTTSGDWPWGSFTQPAWSPDGRKIAFLACAAMNHTYRCGDGAIHVMNPDGSNVRLLARTRGLARPTWSFDGQSIIYANDCWDHNCPSALLYVSVDGTRKGVILDDAHSPSLRR